MTMTVWQLHRQGKGYRLQCIKEYTTRPPKNTTLGIANEFLKDFGKHYNGLFYYGDPSGS